MKKSSSTMQPMWCDVLPAFYTLILKAAQDAYDKDSKLESEYHEDYGSYRDKALIDEYTPLVSKYNNAMNNDIGIVTYAQQTLADANNSLTSARNAAANDQSEIATWTSIQTTFALLPGQAQTAINQTALSTMLGFPISQKQNEHL